jgi:hypothetical protein
MSTYELLKIKMVGIKKHTRSVIAREGTKPFLLKLRFIQIGRETPRMKGGGGDWN